MEDCCQSGLTKQGPEVSRFPESVCNVPQKEGNRARAVLEKGLVRRVRGSPLPAPETPRCPAAGCWRTPAAAHCGRGRTARCPACLPGQRTGRPRRVCSAWEPRQSVRPHSTCRRTREKTMTSCWGGPEPATPGEGQEEEPLYRVKISCIRRAAISF